MPFFFKFTVGCWKNQCNHRFTEALHSYMLNFTACADIKCSTMPWRVHKRQETVELSRWHQHWSKTGQLKWKRVIGFAWWAWRIYSTGVWFVTMVKVFVHRYRYLKSKLWPPVHKSPSHSFWTWSTSPASFCKVKAFLFSPILHWPVLSKSWM